MSFLPGRLAATEGSYFLHESKHAAGRLAEKLPPASVSASSSPASAGAADVLPEILRHSIPIKGASAGSDTSLSTASKWIVNGSGSTNHVSADAINPLRAYISLPQATFGPKRWQVPNEEPYFSASTANDLRRGYSSPAPVDPEKLKVLIRGYSQIGKAFAAATLVIFGGLTSLSIYTAHKLELHTTDDIRTKGRDAIQPRVDKLKEQMSPLRTWVENISSRWHIDGNKEATKNTIFKEFSKAIGVKRSN